MCPTEERQKKFIKVGEIATMHPYSVRISRYIDRGGYKIVALKAEVDTEGYLYKIPLQGAIVIPDDDKLVEFAQALLDISRKA